MLYNCLDCYQVANQEFANELPDGIDSDVLGYAISQNHYSCFVDSWNKIVQNRLKQDKFIIPHISMFWFIIQDKYMNELDQNHIDISLKLLQFIIDEHDKYDEYFICNEYDFEKLIKIKFFHIIQFMLKHPKHCDFTHDKLIYIVDENIEYFDLSDDWQRTFILSFEQYQDISETYYLSDTIQKIKMNL